MMTDNVDRVITNALDKLTSKGVVSKIDFGYPTPSEIQLYRCLNKKIIIDTVSSERLPYKDNKDHLDVFGNNVYCGISTSINGYNSIAKTLEAFKYQFNDDDRLLKIIKKLKSMNGCTSIDSEIFSKYKITVNGNILTMFINIDCTKYVLDGSYKDIPLDHRTTINKLEISIMEDGRILSIKLDKPHPNADKSRHYCLGEDKFKTITLELIERIINRISIYNLDDCYYNPIK